jgi:hypothetical protein
VHLEAFSAEPTKSIQVIDLTVPIDNWGDKVAVPIALFARQLVEKVKALTPPPPKPVEPVVVKNDPPPVKDLPDAPLAVELTPPPVPPPAVVVEEPKSGRPGAIKWVFTVGAIGAAGASVGLLVMGLGDKAKLTGNPTTTGDDLPATKYTYAQASQIANGANTEFAISLGTGILAGLLTAAAVYFFASE